MIERTFSKTLHKAPPHTPHGLSREARGHSPLPMMLGLVCAVLVLVVLWLAYTYL